VHHASERLLFHHLLSDTNFSIWWRLLRDLHLHTSKQIFPHHGLSSHSSRLPLDVALINSKYLKYLVTNSGVEAEFPEFTEHCNRVCRTPASYSDDFRLISVTKTGCYDRDFVSFFSLSSRQPVSLASPLLSFWQLYLRLTSARGVILVLYTVSFNYPVNKKTSRLADPLGFPRP
jgi:hypothetical protein